MNEEPEVVIAGSYGTKEVAVLMLSETLNDIFGRPPRKQNMQMLAGPNDTLQLLMDWEKWELILGGIVTLGGGHIVKLVSEDSYKAIKNLIAELRAKPADDSLATKIPQIEEALTTAAGLGNTVIVGFPMPDDFKRRNLGIELVKGDQDFYVRAVATLAVIGEDLCQLIDAEMKKGNLIIAVQENSDCSGKIELRPDGSVLVDLSIKSKTGGASVSLKVIYDADGVRKS